VLPWLVAAAAGLTACDSDAVIGTDAPLRLLDAGVDVMVGADAGADADSGLTAIPFPWSTGFENGFADYYALPNSFCYLSGGATFGIVKSPVHSGQYAAAFEVSTGGDAGQSQTRCVLQGVLPQSAYYGAWFYVPMAVANFGNWNLIHFQGASGPTMSPTAAVQELWDTSLVNNTSGGLQVTGYDLFQSVTPDAGGGPPIPIGQWFHLEVFLKRASDATGRFAIYQDGANVFELSGVPTDNTAVGQFFVGNLATALVPTDVTVYVDDVTIGASL
jgi:hypothetical protein